MYYLAYKVSGGRWKCKLFTELHNAYAYGVRFTNMNIMWDWSNLRSNYYYDNCKGGEHEAEMR